MTNKEKYYYEEVILEIAERYLNNVNWYRDGGYITSEKGHIINVFDNIVIYRYLSKKELIRYVHELIDEQDEEGEVN